MISLASLVWLACSRVPAPVPAPVVPTPASHAPNDPFLNDVDVATWEARFESADREVFRHRGAIVAALGLQPGQAVADVGAGTGALIEPLVAAVGPEGTVYATELSPSFRAHLEARAAEAGWSTVKVVPSTATTTGLAAGSVAVALLVDVYHHLEAKADFLAELARSIEPGGTLAIVDFDPTRDDAADWIKKHVHQTPDDVRDEIVGTGRFRARAAPDVGLVDNRLQLFERTTE